MVTRTSGAGKGATMGHIVARGFLLVPAKVKWDNAGCGSTGRGRCASTAYRIRLRHGGGRGGIHESRQDWLSSGSGGFVRWVCCERASGWNGCKCAIRRGGWNGRQSAIGWGRRHGFWCASVRRRWAERRSEHDTSSAETRDDVQSSDDHAESRGTGAVASGPSRHRRRAGRSPDESRCDASLFGNRFRRRATRQ